MANQVKFELNEGIQTEDNYSLRLKGYVTFKSDPEEDLSLAIETICRTYFSKKKLIDALEAVEADNSNELIRHFPETLQPGISAFKISTVDAMEISDTPIEIDIDPKLEEQKTKKGIVDKIKSIFAR